MLIRKERHTDVAAIEAVTVAAFAHAQHSGHTEQFIVEALRHAGALAVSLVVDDRDTVIAHVAVSPVSLSDGTTGWYGLGPVSVTPRYQRQGIGTRLIEHALAETRALGASGCVVLGEPGYYGRFGFTTTPSLLLPGVPPAYFQALAFNGRLPSGSVSYHAAFAARS